VYSSVAGTSHVGRGLPCQDHSLIRDFTTVADEPILLLVASDGAGSASCAEVASKLVCDSVLGRVDEYVRTEPGASGMSRELVTSWLDDGIRRDLYQQAAAAEINIREFACTIIVAVLRVDASVFFQIGDGAVVVGQGEEYRPVFWPQNGEYANTTCFVTDDAAVANLLYEKIDGPAVDEVAVFTDGIQNLALKFEDRSAYAPFFRPMFERLRQEPAGESEVLTPMLQEFLVSDAVIRRTDDDKTLLLATRRPVEAGVIHVEEHGRPPATV